MSVSPFDDPILCGLLGDAELAALFTPQAALAGMIDFETALADAQAAEGIVPVEAAAEIAARLPGIALDFTSLALGTARDGVVVPDLLRQLRGGLSAQSREWLHVGATSQDAIDTSLALRLAKASSVLRGRIEALARALDALQMRDGRIVTMGHTRMQAAIPVPASRKILSWRDPLARNLERLEEVVAEVALLHLGGAAGTLDRFASHGPAVGARMAAVLGLSFPARPRHGERDGIVAFASWLSLTTGSLGKLGQDIALLAQSEVAEIRLAGGGGSSAMPHKSNPVGAEMLVAFARFNATLVSGMHHALVHENERSGAAWTLEWLLLPQMVVATGAALWSAEALVRAASFVARD
jgi:3-carboxy-cis,cis-muconate cycloisomerase